MLREIVAPLLLGLLAGVGAQAECDVTAKPAAEAACAAYPVLCGRALESCSLRLDDDTGLSRGLLRFAPHEQHERERRHWQVLCEETGPRVWSCRALGITRTAQLSDAGDWAEILGEVSLGDLSLERAREIADFARAEVARGLEVRTPSGERRTLGPSDTTDVDFILPQSSGFLIALNMPETPVCIWLTPRDGSFLVGRATTC